MVYLSSYAKFAFENLGQKLRVEVQYSDVVFEVIFKYYKEVKERRLSTLNNKQEMQR